MGNGWMSPLDQGKYASYLFFHGLLDKAQYEQLDEIGEVFYKSANCDPPTALLASNIKSESVKRHLQIFFQQTAKSWIRLHSKSGWRRGKVIFHVTILFYSFFLGFVTTVKCFPFCIFSGAIFEWLPFSGSDQQLNFILTALNYSNLYDISKVIRSSIIISSYSFFWISKLYDISKVLCFCCCQSQVRHRSFKFFFFNVGCL